MSCDGNRGVYFTHICATAGMGSGVTPAELETLYDKHVGEPRSQIEALANDAKTQALFDDMRKTKITPPTHSPTGLPKVPSRRGYAAVYDDLKRRGWINDEPAVAVVDDTVQASASRAGASGMLADETAGGVAVAAPPAKPSVAVQGKPGRIDTVAFRVSGGQTYYVWGGSWLSMKDFIKGIPGPRKPWFRGGNVNVWELYCSQEEAEAALKGEGWQITREKPTPLSVALAGAAIVNPDGKELVPARPPAAPTVPVLTSDGSLVAAPVGSPLATQAAAQAAAGGGPVPVSAAVPAAPESPPAASAAPAASTPPPVAPRPSPTPPPAPTKSRAELQQESEEQAKAFLVANPGFIDAANHDATIDPEGQGAAQLQRWADAARDVYTGDVKRLIGYGDTSGVPATKYFYYVQAMCHAGGTPRCDKCQQFKSDSHVCPEKRYDDSGFNSRGYNRRGYNKKGFNAQGRDEEGRDEMGFAFNAQGQDLNRRGYTRNGVLPDGSHDSGFTTHRDADGLDFYGYSRVGRDAEGYDRNGYGTNGRDRNDFDARGYRADGAFIGGMPDAQGVYNDGYDAEGYGADGYGADGYDRWLFSRKGLTGLRRFNVQRKLYKDGRDSDGMRYSFDGYNVLGFTPTGFNNEGRDATGEPRRMRSPKTGKMIRATYDERGVDPHGYDRWGFSVTDGLSVPDEQGRRIAPNGWIFDPTRGDLYDPEEPTRRMAHFWEARSGRLGRSAAMRVISTGTPPAFMPPEELIDARRAPCEALYQTLGRDISGTVPWRDPPAPLDSHERMMRMRAAHDPKAAADGILLTCPYCHRFTGGKPHSCPHFNKLAKSDPHKLGQNVVVAANGMVVDERADLTLVRGITQFSAYTGTASTQWMVYNPARPEYDPTYRFGGYSYDGFDPDGIDRQGYNRQGRNAKGYDREGFDVFGYDADGYDRRGYNRQGKDREGQQRPLSVEELKRSLAPGEEPLENDEMARHYSRLAQAITGKPVTVKFDKSIPTGATDMRGNILLNPHPLGKEADPRRNFLVTKAIMYHEVGHELTTNPDHWAELKGIAQSPEPVESIDKGRAHILRIYNIVEDGRMERDMSDRFPGVAGALAAAARLRDKWDFTVGEGIPVYHQVMGAMLYTTLPYYRVPQEVVDKMTPEARALFEKLRPIALRGALGSQEDALEASKEIARQMEQAGVFDAPQQEQDNLEVTPPGGEAGNRPSKPPKPPKEKQPPTPPGPVNGMPKDKDEEGDGEDGEREGEGKDKPNGRGKGWRKGQKTAQEDEPVGNDGGQGDDDDGGQGGSSGGDDDEGEEGGQGDDGSSGGASGEEEESGGSGSSSGSAGDDGAEEGKEGGGSGSSSTSGALGNNRGGTGERNDNDQDGDGDGSGDEGSDEPNGRGQGWRKGLGKGEQDEEGDGSGGGAGDDEDGDEGDDSGSSVGGAGSGDDWDEDDEGDDWDEGDEGDEGGGGGAQGGSSGGKSGSQGDGAQEGDEGGQGGSSGRQQSRQGAQQGGQQSQQRQGAGEEGDEEGDGGSSGGTWGDEDEDDGGAWDYEDSDGEASGDSDEASDGESGGDSGQSGARRNSSEQQGGREPPPPQPQRERNPDAMVERNPEMGEGDDNLGGDGGGGDPPPSGGMAISGELFDPVKPFNDAELDAALKAADREAAQVIATSVRRQANYDVLGKRLHRKLSNEPSAQQPIRTPDGRAEYINVGQPRSENAAHMRTLEGQAPLHRQVSGQLARQLERIRAQADERLRFQTSGKLDQRRLVAAVRGVDEVRQQVRETPQTSMAISVTMDFSGSMNRHISSGKVYNAANILGSTFEQLDMPYELRGHADASAIFKAMDDERREPARMAMMAVDGSGNGCGGGNSETAPTMALATTSLLARPERNKLIVSLMDGDMYDHGETVQQLAEARKQGVVTFCVFLGQPNAGQQKKLSEMYGAGGWVQINDLSEMPQAVGRRLARAFEAMGRK